MRDVYLKRMLVYTNDQICCNTAVVSNENIVMSVLNMSDDGARENVKLNADRDKSVEEKS